MLGMKNHFDISDSIEICEVDIAGVACIFGISDELQHMASIEHVWIPKRYWYRM